MLKCQDRTYTHYYSNLLLVLVGKFYESLSTIGFKHFQYLTWINNFTERMWREILSWVFFKIISKNVGLKKSRFGWIQKFTNKFSVFCNLKHPTINNDFGISAKLFFVAKQWYLRIKKICVTLISLYVYISKALSDQLGKVLIFTFICRNYTVSSCTRMSAHNFVTLFSTKYQIYTLWLPLCSFFPYL